MNKITAVRRIQFCAGHRVFKHESKCANMHGHNYVAFFHAQADDLDSIGRVIDFGVLKEKLGEWIDRKWDHGFIFFNEDHEVFSALTGIHGQKWFALDVNPTAENMASYLLNKIGPICLEGTGVRLVKVVLWETENCFAEVST